jgi:arylsulfatase A-like enzyme
LIHVPLMFVNPNLFRHEGVVDRLMRQLDVAPTLLSLLNF